jgi:hypothetical protein
MKLYWRVKIDGKWTYKAATIDEDFFEDPEMILVFKELKE